MYKIGITKFLARLLEHKDALIRCDSLELLCLLVKGDTGKVRKSENVSAFVAFNLFPSLTMRHIF
jgi:hypothetical protein